MKIIKYEPKYEEDARQIFLWAGSKETRETPGIRELKHAIFCDYYLKYEADSCFIAVNDEDRAVGYILCAKDYSETKRKIDAYIQEKQMDNLDKSLHEATDWYSNFIDDYSAHLHIDLLPEYQRQGIGTKLMNTLIQYLYEKNINGVILGVASKNEKGMNFYHKYGFKELYSMEGGTIMGYKIKKQN